MVTMETMGDDGAKFIVYRGGLDFKGIAAR
jgi:hypothetical protein